MLKPISNVQGEEPGRDADALRRRTIRAGRWFSGYLVVIGLVSAASIVVLEAVFQNGFARSLTVAAWALFIVLAGWWAEPRSAYPAGASRYLVIATVIWFGAYLLIIGPLVRWQFGEAVVPWIIAALAMSIPFFAAATLLLRRR